MKPEKISRCVFACIFLLCLGAADKAHAAKNPNKKLEALVNAIGDRDALLIANSKGKIILGKHADKKLAPASTFKLLTSLAAIHYLGLNYRFPTDFYVDENSDLKIKGYGDPMLISEILPNICKAIRGKIGDHAEIRDIVLDHSYFEPLTVPGVSTSLKAYDASNGALGVNFNTLSFHHTGTGYESGEPQTPLVYFPIDKIRALGLTKGRIPLSSENNEATLYAGHLFRHFLEKEDIRVTGGIRIGSVGGTDVLVLRYMSDYVLSEILAMLLESSNNFIANQVFLTIGASVYGSPGTLEKSIAAVSEYTKTVLKTEDIHIAEGSGISRDDRISASDMLRILDKFKQHRHLMRKKGRAMFKTGTLSDVSTLAGYIEDSKGERYSFVIFCNTPGKSAKKIMAKLLKVLK